jgi:cysteine desulfuration protein SufE
MAVELGPGSAYLSFATANRADSPLNAIAELLSDFEVLDDWEDRYKHVIELGRALPELPEAERSPENKVRGCASQVWITSDSVGPPSNPVLHFRGDSDALIVKGLIAIAFMIYSGRPATEILATDAGEVLGKLGLSGHLTQQRSNGFASMIQRIKQDAQSALQASSG